MSNSKSNDEAPKANGNDAQHDDGAGHESRTDGKNSGDTSGDATNVKNLKTDVNSVDYWRTEAEKFKNEYLYLMAEFENYKKNVIKERSDLRKYGSERLVVEVLNGIDLLDRALDSNVTGDNVDSFRKGIELTSQQFKAMLQKFGVEELRSEER